LQAANVTSDNHIMSSDSHRAVNRTGT